MSGVSLQTRLDALFAAYWRKNLEKSLSTAREDWTEMMTSEER